jgi:hypothetical protein
VSRITPGTMIVAIFAVLLGLVGAYAVRRHLNPPVWKFLRKPLDAFPWPVAMWRQGAH